MMNQQEMKCVFNYVKANIKYLDNGCDTDNIIDFENGEDFCIYDLLTLKEEYEKLYDDLEDYVESNELDDVIDYKKIAEKFPYLVINRYLKYEQAVLIYFEDFALLKAKQVANKL